MGVYTYICVTYQACSLKLCPVQSGSETHRQQMASQIRHKPKRALQIKTNQIYYENRESKFLGRSQIGLGPKATVQLDGFSCQASPNLLNINVLQINVSISSIK